MIIDHDQEHTQDQSIVAFVDNLIQQAVQKNASDIHLEPRANHLRVRFRQDGMLYDQSQISSDLMQQIIARVKVLAHINIAQKRLPQDGKFCVEHNGCSIDLRVSTFPTLFGEKIVIRILDRAGHMIALEKLGFSDHVLEQFKKTIGRAHGFFLVTGPTGSGKTTTLYAVLSILNDKAKNIVTLEDPVEYHLDGVTQGQIQSDAGFGFEDGMRALLRQDPNILMVGEIRDKKTAQIAIEAALTGHVVLSTLHTNDAPSAFVRLIEMGIEPFLINAALTGVLAQRLVRTICTACSTQKDITDAQKKYAEHFDIKANIIFEGEGCDACDTIGYKGRTGLFEFLQTTPALANLINTRASHEKIKQQAVADGMQTLAQDGAAKVASGAISLLELVRVLG